MTLPAKDDLASLGGTLTDYGVSVTDPTTDLSAAASNQFRADVAMMSRTAVRAWVRFSGHATTPTIVASDAVWGATPPTVAHAATGTYTVTWPATVSDALGVTQAVNFGCVVECAVDSQFLASAQAVLTSANVVTVYTFNSAGSANDLAGTNIRLLVI